MRRKSAVLTVALLLFGLTLAYAQKKGDTGTRSVEGVVSATDDAPAVESALFFFLERSNEVSP